MIDTFAELVERRNVALTRLLKLLESKSLRQQYEILTNHLNVPGLERLVDLWEKNSANFRR